MSKISVKCSINLTAFVDESGKSIFAEPIEFFAKPFLAETQREIMQAHLGLSVEERKAKGHEYNVTLLSKLAARPPVGLPGFPEAAEDLEAAVFGYLIDPTETNEIVAGMLKEAHLEAAGGRYFFR